MSVFEKNLSIYANGRVTIRVTVSFRVCYCDGTVECAFQIMPAVHGSMYELQQ